MLLKEIYNYIAEQGAVTTYQLQRRFGVNHQHIEHIITTWAERGKIKPLYGSSTSCESKSKVLKLCGTCRTGCATATLTLWCLA